MLLTKEQKEQLQQAGIRVPSVSETCIGCSACVAISPEVFDLDDEGMSVVIKRDNYEGLGVEDSISACPVNAIIWE